MGRGLVIPSHKDLKGWLKSIAGKAKIKKLKFKVLDIFIPLIDGGTTYDDLDESSDRVTRNRPDLLIGIGAEVGSLAPWLDDSLFFRQGDPLEIRTNVLQAYIQGRKIDMDDHHKSLYHKYQEKYRQLGILKE